MDWSERGPTRSLEGMMGETRHRDAKRPVLVPALLWVFSGLLIALQYMTLAKFSALPPGRSFGGPLRFYQAAAEGVDFDIVDGLLFGLVLVVGLALVGLEADDVFAPGFIRNLQEVTRDLDALPGLAHVLSITNVEDFAPDPVAGGIVTGLLVDRVPKSPEDSAALRAKVLSRTHAVGSLPMWVLIADLPG